MPMAFGYRSLVSFILIILQIKPFLAQNKATDLTYTGLGGDPTNFCTNVPFVLTLFPVDTADTVGDITTLTVMPSGYCRPLPSTAANTKSVTLTCSRAQTYLIQLTTTLSAALKKKIAVDNCQDLYGWHAVAVIPPAAGASSDSAVVDMVWTSDKLTVRLWVQNRQKLNTQVTDDKTIPNDDGAKLTKIYQAMGLSPRLLTNFRDQFDIFFYCDTTIPPTFNKPRGFYTFSCPRTPNDRHGYYNYGLTSGTSHTLDSLIGPAAYNQEIGLQSLADSVYHLPVELTYQQKFQVTTSGQPDYFGFTVSSNTFTLTRPKFTLPPLTTYTALTWPNLPGLRSEPCNTNFVIGLPSTGDIYYTNDEFQTTTKLTVKLGDLTTAILKEVQVTKSYIFFLTSTNQIYTLYRNSTNGIANLMTLSTGDLVMTTIVGLKVADWCTNPSNTAARDIFLAWSSTGFVMGTSEASPSKYFVMKFPDAVLRSAASGTVIDMALDRTYVLPPARQGCLLLVSASTGLFVDYYYGTFKSTQQDNWLSPGYNKGTAVSSTPDNNARMQTMVQGIIMVVVRTGISIYRVSPTDSFSYTLRGASNAALPMDSVQATQFARSGSLLFQTSTANVYLGDANSLDLMRIQKSVPSNYVIRMDRFDVPWLVLVSSTISSIQFLDGPTQLLNGDVAVPACPYAIFDSHGDEIYRPVDVGTTYTVVSSLWIPAASAASYTPPIDLDVVVAIPPENNHIKDDDLNVTILTDRTVNGDLVKVSKTILIQNAYNTRPGDAIPRLPRTSAMTYITVRPTVTKPSCTARSQRGFYAKAMCPPGVSIRLIPQNPCSAPYPTTFTIDKQYLSDQTAKQDVTPPPNLQCDAPSYHDAYVPVLGLYYFGTLIENVTVDYYLFEENWRNDYTYSQTEADAGCLRGSQNTNSTPGCVHDPVLISATDNSGYACWGPASYRPCFTSPTGTDQSANPKQIYQIMNATGGNSILFPPYHTVPPIYVFVAQVLEPNYSFCNLATQFVVMPSNYGDTPDPLIPVYCFFASCGGLLLFFWIVYTVYSVSWNENRVGFQMLQKTPVPQAWHMLTSGEHRLLFTGTDGPRKIYVPGDVFEKKTKVE